MRKTLLVLILLMCVVIIGGFIALSVWDVPVAKKEVEKPVDASSFLEKKP
jgi:hypothetical protein